MFFNLSMEISVWQDRAPENLKQHFRVIVRGNPVDGDLSALDTAVDQHHLSWVMADVFLAGLFEGQSNRLHMILAGRKAVSSLEKIEMPGPQAVRAVVAVIHTREDGICGNVIAAVQAAEISKSLSGRVAGRDKPVFEPGLPAVDGGGVKKVFHYGFAFNFK